MKALIVDPSRVVVTTLSMLFDRYGISSSSVGCGQDALNLLEHERVDLICFAYELWDMNGIDMFIAARANKLLHHEPGLMFAATHDKAAVDRALDAGVTECFSKSNLAQLEQFIEKFAAGGQGRIDGSVLLVEDSSSAAMLYRRTLELMGLCVEHCRSAEEAIPLIEQQNFDLVITDYVLAGVETGFSVIRAVRELPGRKSTTPVLAISAFDNTARKVEVLRNGANDFVAKPVVMEELAARVTNLVTLRKLMRRLESQHEAMKLIAMRDQLTSLYNRHYLYAVLPGLVEDSRLRNQPLALMVIDIDHFKNINDTHGHNTGDQVLELIAGAMQRFFSRADVVVRLGGEEFVVILPNASLAQASHSAEELRRRIESLLPCSIPVTMSLGVTVLARDEGYENFFSRADAAMYRSKAKGRNRVEAHAAPVIAQSANND
jgi:two-component system cell cycle response regulator